MRNSGVVRVALASLDLEWEQKATNLSRCRDACRRARALAADFVVFPEMTLTGFTMNADAVAEPVTDSPTTRQFAEIARAHRVAVGFGVVLEGARRPTNSFVVVNAAGEQVASYAKIHPFSVAGENDRYEAGDALAIAEIGGLRFGLSVCYDLRFPELYAGLAPRCDAIIVIANWPAQRIEHWDALLRARAIDGQCYVIGVNRTGEDANAHRYPRSSQVIDPRGVPLAARAGDGEVDVFVLDGEEVRGWRAAFPIAADRRHGLYPQLSD